MHLALERGRKGGHDLRLREGASKYRRGGSSGLILQGQFWRALRNPRQNLEPRAPPAAETGIPNNLELELREKQQSPLQALCPLSRAPPRRRHHLLAPLASSWVAARPGLCVLQAGLSAWGRGASRRARPPPLSPRERERTWGRQTLRRGARRGGRGRVNPAEGDPHLGLEPGWLCAPAASRPEESVRPSCCGVRSAGTGRAGARGRPPGPWGGEAGPVKPQGAGASRCQGPVQVQGAEGARPAETRLPPAGALRARAAARLLPEGPGGRGWAPAWGRRLDLGTRAQLAQLEAREEGKRKGLHWDRVPRPPGTRHPDSPGQGWGEAVLSPGAWLCRLSPPRS